MQTYIKVPYRQLGEKVEVAVKMALRLEVNSLEMPEDLQYQVEVRPLQHL
jgi:hypothetical protein